MTAVNPHPLANPLNQSRFRNFGYCTAQQSRFSINRAVDPKDLTVPDSVPYSGAIASQQRELTVPNSDIPYYSGPIPAKGFLGDSPLFKLSDGSVLDLKKCRVVYDPSKKWQDIGYWNDPSSQTKKPHPSTEWGPTESIEQLLSRTSRPDSTCSDPNLDPASIAYWQKADEESKKLEQNLTEEQKKLVGQLQAGELFPLARLVEESDVKPAK